MMRLLLLRKSAASGSEHFSLLAAIVDAGSLTADYFRLGNADQGGRAHEPLAVVQPVHAVRLVSFELFHVEKWEAWKPLGESQVIDDEVALSHLVARTHEVNQVLCVLVVGGIVYFSAHVEGHRGGSRVVVVVLC